MLEILFGNQNTERILFSLLIKEKCYAKELADRFDSAVYGFQTTLQKLEKAGILVSYKKVICAIFNLIQDIHFLQNLNNY